MINPLLWKLPSPELPELRHGLDGPFCAAVAALLACGLIMVASASVAIGEKMTGNPLFFFERQLGFAILGIALGIVIFIVPMEFWQRKGPWLMIAALVLLFLVLIPGIGLKINSARRWIGLGLFRMQASEPARLAVIVYLAGYIVRRQVRLQSSLAGLAAPFVPLSIVSFLLLLEPDFGATVILVAVAMLMLFLGGARLIYLGSLLATTSVLMGLLAIGAAYRLKRLTVFLHPWDDPERSGWQLTQSLIAVGRGQWFGVGLGNSVQKLLYLPEMNTDFIFAIYAEEFGLVGVIALVALFGLLVWRGFAIGREAEKKNQRFAAYLAYGLSGWLGLQAMINMAVNMGILPTKGLTLPFISYGGSSLLTVSFMVALILRVDYENRRLRGPASTARGSKAAPRGGFRHTLGNAYARVSTRFGVRIGRRMPRAR